jgi:hypothetical protein
MSFGSEFHKLGAADINARSPKVFSDLNFGCEDEVPGAEDEVPDAEDEVPGAEGEVPGAEDEVPGAEDTCGGRRTFSSLKLVSYDVVFN